MLEETGAAALLLVDDIQGGDAGDGVDIIMVVGDGSHGLIDEIVAVAHLTGDAPDAIDPLAGIPLRKAFLVKGGVLSSYHVEQNAHPKSEGRAMGIGSPVLRAEGPGLRIIAGREVP